MITRRTALTLGLAGVAGLAGPAPAGGRGWSLVCRHQRTGEVLAGAAVAPGTLVHLSWIHSIERSPWEETFRCESTGFTLVETRFEAFGAGMPYDAGEGRLTVEDGRVVIRDLARPFPVIRWIHSRRTRHQVSLGEDRTPFIPSEQLPDREPVELVRGP